MVYLDNGATTYKKPKEVIDKIIYGLNNMGNGGRGVNSSSLETSRMIYETREKIVHFFNGKDPKNLIFTSNSTESLNLVINGILTEKDHVITTEMEHNSVLRPLYRLKREKGVELTILNKNEVLFFKNENIKKYLKDNTKALICTHASNLTGDIVEIEKIGKFCKENNIIFIVDASQSAGIIPIDIQKSNIDILCFTGHKSLYGPQGIGGAYISERVIVSPLKVGGSGIDTYNEKHPEKMPERLEAGTLNAHGIIGLNAAIDFINKIGIENIYIKENNLMWKLYEGIKKLKKIKIYGNFYDDYNNKIKRCPIIALNIGNIDSNEICDILNMEYDIVTRAGGHCAPLMHKSLGTEQQGAVRFSISYFNSEKDIETVIKALEIICKNI